MIHIPLNMVILQINTVCGRGSTGSICVDIASQLEKMGHTCYIAYGQGNTDYEKSYKIGSKLENYLHNIGSRLLGNQGYYTAKGTRRLVKYIEHVKPDIIHLHNLHGNYLNLRIIFNFLSMAGISVVWTLHDCWAFTGKCAHYTSAGCYKWEKQCGHCPQFRSYPSSLFLDRSRRLYTDKKKWFTSIDNMAIVSVSRWLQKEASRSFLSKYPVSYIYNWVDYKKFFPQPEDIRKKYQIPEDKFILLSVSAGWNKNTSRYKDAMELMKMLPEDMHLVMVGQCYKDTEIPPSITHIPYIQGAEELAKVYSAADVYVHLSVEDTFGKVIAEAMACGTPSIVFDSTACPELIGNNCGYVVRPHNVSDIIAKANIIKKNGKKYFSTPAINYVKENFDYERNVMQIIRLYEKLISR